MDAAQELTRRHGILVLPGAEINTDAGHVLVFGLHQYKFGMHKPGFLREEADRHGAVLIAAHPYRRRFLADPGEDPAVRSEMLNRALDDQMLRLFDAIEIEQRTRKRRRRTSFRRICARACAFREPAEATPITSGRWAPRQRCSSVV